MANIKSALKRAKQNVIRRERNSHFRSHMRGRIRAVRDAVEAGDADKAKAMLIEATSALHRVVNKGIIHSKSADRQISRLNKAVKTMG